MNHSWSPLFSDIIASSIWDHPNHVKVVWVTMLAIKNQQGFVEASIPGIKRFAAVTLEEAVDAIRILESPDEHSKSEGFAGQKIQKVDGGWMVLGHERHQEKMKVLCLKANNAKRQAEFRERDAARKAANPLIPAKDEKRRATAKDKAERLEAEINEARHSTGQVVAEDGATGDNIPY